MGFVYCIKTLLKPWFLGTTAIYYYSDITIMHSKCRCQFFVFLLLLLQNLSLKIPLCSFLFILQCFKKEPSPNLHLNVSKTVQVLTI